MHSWLVLLFAFLVISPAAASSPDTGTYLGYWVCKTNCGCRPSGPYSFASVREEQNRVLVRNECGNDATVRKITDQQFHAAEWNASASLSSDGSRLQWSNGSIWGRLDPNSSELD